jgi:hypothetical protein
MDFMNSAGVRLPMELCDRLLLSGFCTRDQATGRYWQKSRRRPIQRRMGRVARRRGAMRRSSVVSAASGDPTIFSSMAQFSFMYSIAGVRSFFHASWTAGSGTCLAKVARKLFWNSSNSAFLRPLCRCKTHPGRTSSAILPDVALQGPARHVRMAFSVRTGIPIRRTSLALPRQAPWHRRRQARTLVARLSPAEHVQDVGLEV